MKQITDKTVCIMLRGGYKVFVTSEEAGKIADALEGGSDMIRLSGKVFMKNSITFILPAHEVEREEKIRRGDWKCELGYWHAKGEQCGHGLKGR